MLRGFFVEEAQKGGYKPPRGGFRDRTATASDTTPSLGASMAGIDSVTEQLNQIPPARIDRYGSDPRLLDQVVDFVRDQLGAATKTRIKDQNFHLGDGTVVTARSEDLAALVLQGRLSALRASTAKHGDTVYWIGQENSFVEIDERQTQFWEYVLQLVAASSVGKSKRNKQSKGLTTGQLANLKIVKSIYPQNPHGTAFAHLVALAGEGDLQQSSDKERFLKADRKSPMLHIERQLHQIVHRQGGAASSETISLLLWGTVSDSSRHNAQTVLDSVIFRQSTNKMHLVKIGDAYLLRNRHGLTVSLDGHQIKLMARIKHLFPEGASWQQLSKVCGIIDKTTAWRRSTADVHLDLMRHHQLITEVSPGRWTLSMEGQQLLQDATEAVPKDVLTDAELIAPLIEVPEHKPTPKPVLQIMSQIAAAGASKSAEPLSENDQVALVPDVDDDSFDFASLDDERERVPYAGALRPGQARFRAAVLAAYEGRCAFTGTAVAAVLDAAHIVPYRGEKSNAVQNGMPLRSDLHRLFDAYLVTVTSADLSIRVSPELAGTGYEQLDGKTMALPLDPEQWPSGAALRSHNEMCSWLD